MNQEPVESKPELQEVREKTVDRPATQILKESKLDNRGKLEILALQRSLSGKELPTDWPTIASTDEELRGYEALYSEGEDMSQPPQAAHVDKLSYELTTGDKRLRYFAVTHSPQPENSNYKQYAVIETQFKKSPPEIVFYEGGESNARFASREHALQFGEPAFVQYLVQEHNDHIKPGEKLIRVVSADIPQEAKIQAYRDLGHTDEEIAIADILSKFNFLSDQINHDLNLTDQEKASKLLEDITLMKSDPQAFAKNYGFPNIFTLLKRADGQPWSVKAIDEDFLRLTGKQLTSQTQAHEIPMYQKMFEEANVFRDKYIVKKVAASFLAHNKVDIVFGSGHAIREKKAFKDYFDSETTTLAA